MKEEDLDMNIDSRQDKVDFTAVIEIINNLAISVKEMTGRVDNFKNSMEDKVTKIEAEIVLIKNRLNMIDANRIRISDEKIAVTESNEHMFSFADEDKRTKEAVSVMQPIPAKIVNNGSDTEKFLQSVKYRLEESKRLLEDLK
jgi:hypothetical protein